MREHRLSEKWIKASITGTIWAASEIVLGSFLHNLRIPFTGNILTAIGIMILISVGYIWTDRGLFWRAGLVCALMKTMSPSAVIFGPMIAIFTEAVLLELFVRLLGRNFIGFAIGSMLAMSWNLFQKIFNYIIMYGTNIIDVYSNILKFAQKQLNIRSDIVWIPLIILLILYALFGLLAAIEGMRIGRKLKAQPSGNKSLQTGSEPGKLQSDSVPGFKYSVIWLFVNLILMVISFILLNKTQWYVWGSVITVTVTIWAVRYKRALKKLSKPGFWILFVLITLITAFAFTIPIPGYNRLMAGLLTGVQMNFRAALMIVGFSVTGTELYNPVVRDFFLRGSFKNLPLALELSAESLPMLIAYIPDFRTLVNQPVSVFRNLIGYAEFRLEELKDTRTRYGKVILITGSIGGGKTTFVRNLVAHALRNGLTPVGIISEKVIDISGDIGYDIENIETGDRFAFLRLNGNESSARIGRFYIREEGLAAGRSLLNELVSRSGQVIIIDEVGMLELQDDGWSENVSGILGTSNDLILAVRDIYLESLRAKWELRDAMVADITKTDPDSVINFLL